MSSPADLAAQLLRLPAAERARLAAVLLESLDGEQRGDEELTAAALQRSTEIDAGAVKLLDADAVLAATRSRIT